MRMTRRLVAAFGAVVLVLTLGGNASGQVTVTPGAFCSPAGATGVTVTGLAMVCSTTAADPNQLRWRQAGTVTTTTAVPPTTTTTVASPPPTPTQNQTRIISITDVPGISTRDQPLDRTG